MLEKLFLSAIFSVLLAVSSFAAITDAFSRSYWVSKSGITTGTTNDIMFQYFGTLGYTGSLNDRYFQWLVDQTGLPDTSSFNDLLYACFVTGVPGYYVYNGDGTIVTNGDGTQVTYE